MHENSPFLGQFFAMKTKSRQKSNQMYLKENFLQIPNIKSDFRQLKPFSRYKAFFRPNFRHFGPFRAILGHFGANYLENRIFPGHAVFTGSQLKVCSIIFRRKKCTSIAQIFCKFRKSSKNDTFFDFLNDPDFFSKIRLCNFSSFILL